METGRRHEGCAGKTEEASLALFNVTFDKNLQLSGQKETSTFFTPRIQHEVIILEGGTA